MLRNAITRTPTDTRDTTPDSTHSETGVLQIDRMDFRVVNDSTDSSLSMAMAAIAHMRAVAARVAQSGGLRAPIEVRLAAHSAIERGAGAEEVIAAHHLTHPQDIANMRAAAARVAQNGRPAESRPV